MSSVRNRGTLERVSLASQTDFSHAHALAGKNGLGTPAQNPGPPAEIYGGPLVQFSRFAPRPISSSAFFSSFQLASTFSPSFFHFLPQLFSISPPAFFTFSPSFFHSLPQLFFTFSPSFLSRPRFRGAPSIIRINYAHALESANHHQISDALASP